MFKRKLKMLLPCVLWSLAFPGSVQAAEGGVFIDPEIENGSKHYVRPEIPESIVKKNWMDLPPNMQHISPSTFEEAAGLYIKDGKTWYEGLTAEQKQAAQGFYALIERGDDRRSDHERSVKSAVVKFYETLDIHQFKTTRQFQELLAGMSGMDAAEFFCMLMERSPKGVLFGASSYYIVLMRLFGQLPKEEQTLRDMQIFSYLYDKACRGEFLPHTHNEKVYLLMIRDRLDAKQSLTMKDVEDIFNGPRNKLYLAKGIVEKGPQELIVGSCETVGLILFGTLMVCVGGAHC